MSSHRSRRPADPNICTTPLAPAGHTKTSSRHRAGTDGTTHVNELLGVPPSKFERLTEAFAAMFLRVELS